MEPAPSRSSLQLQRGPPDPDLVPRVHLRRALHLLAVQVRAVRRPEVLHVPGAVLRIQPRMELGGVSVLQPDMAGLGPPDLELVLQRVRPGLLPVLPPDDDPGGGPAGRPALRAPSGKPGRPPPGSSSGRR